jgi:elongator complex protein 2
VASGSQDNYIRLWRISPVTERAEQANGDHDHVAERPEGEKGNALDMLDEFERKLAGEAGYGGSVQISTKAHVLAVDDGSTYVPFSPFFDHPRLCS